MAEDDAAAAREAAVRFLARREHSTRELEHKLGARGFEPAAVAGALEGLAAEGLLSDERFAEAFVASRIEKGSGPRRIQAELRERGLTDELIARYVDFSDRHWRERAARARRKRFGAAPPGDLHERARQARFLQYRGFTADQARAALTDEDDELGLEDDPDAI
ncbi:MAG TPA: regulatory protein RecX [Gammaproteobacteria bacterium]|nr:regulatory protein RecX [Gammaproteobacteria bacterium]